MIGEYYEYKGERLTQAEIARKENINRSTLADWYKKTGNMELAVEGAKKSQAQRNIPYNNEVLSLKAIADKENVKFESLKKNYEATNDIYKAVELTKSSQLKRSGDIEYNGQMLTILAISKLEGIGNHSLAKIYSETKDIYKAVKIAKANQEKQRGTILYKGNLMTITGIAQLEGIKHETLKKYYEIYGNIEKAVFITKASQLKRQKALYKGRVQTIDELSKILKVSPIKISKIVESGQSIDDVIQTENNEVLTKDGQSLYSYCLEHSYNYWVIYYLVNNYGKSIEEAVSEYLANGQSFPIKWIYEKYNILFKHLTLSFGLDSNRIIKIMKEDECDLKSAISKLIFKMNNQNNDLTLIEIDWLYELYDLLKDCTENEYPEYLNAFYVTERELSIIREKKKTINEIERQLLLFEFAEVIDDWSVEDLCGMLELYEITDDELLIILIDLYKPFDNGIINPNIDYQKQKEEISNLVKLSDIEYELKLETINLSEEEIAFINSKRKILQNIKIYKKILSQTNKTI